MPAPAGIAIPPPFRHALAGRPAAVGPAARPHGNAHGDRFEGCSGDQWLARLPALLAHCADRWRLHSAGHVWHGVTALVIACRQEDRPVALKLTWPHPEARQEHLALRYWDGHGAVRLLAADPAHWALLLERADGDRALTSAPLPEACETIGRLHVALDRPAPAAFDRIADLAPSWLDRLRQGSPGVPRRLTGQAASLLAGLTSAAQERLVHEDLHFGHVLAAERCPWLAIDPTPVAAEWAYAVAPVLWNRWGDVAAADHLRTHLRTRAHLVAEAAGLDEQRVHAWSLVRCIRRAVQEMDQARPDLAQVSRMVAIAKAMSG